MVGGGRNRHRGRDQRVGCGRDLGAGLDGYADQSLDAIVTNPPFHQGVAKDSSDTIAMFDEATRVLRPGGQLWCVFNSHLPYRKELNVRLGRTQIALQDPNFTVTVTTAR
ncbi:methyltransferase [Tessaracoccus sp. HDW20]|uniref:methyltransferase n=1 Tax=Tessaracoccus coleopterorum TaxID=2714950 RepID=UPI0018D46ACE|nr:methyltransferase [Tessaracoccus coleopterorum]